ncbi:hypothetical protein B9Q04_04725 [Candidatus Marsarchaeota G2 archaeon BE_D]|uniref:Uncharacterized protein n=1 Tax=Candidatus Marsarchaeota G2 archaeon BE_D TaxID=1978158 RepID=A0A2R6CCK3_9ARCH|nr:MAG: hypothetical protein B9Q04_04725 [Candidatus Marsarchaeota G2 archaeon BE_D]
MQRVSRRKGITSNHLLSGRKVATRESRQAHSQPLLAPLPSTSHPLFETYTQKPQSGFTQKATKKK